VYKGLPNYLGTPDQHGNETSGSIKNGESAKRLSASQEVHKGFNCYFPPALLLLTSKIDVTEFMEFILQRFQITH
jgi:hypothetical protein